MEKRACDPMGLPEFSSLQMDSPEPAFILSICTGGWEGTLVHLTGFSCIPTWGGEPGLGSIQTVSHPLGLSGPHKVAGVHVGHRQLPPPSSLENIEDVKVALFPPLVILSWRLTPALGRTVTGETLKRD